jgi:two-component system CheB/CheR fusion protein
MAKKAQEIEKKVKLSSAIHNFPIVGIGASAGGLDAFKQMIEAIPANSEMAYVVVQHLNPEYDSNLTEILSRVSKIPIQEITDEVEILPNHIYVMPSGKILTSVDGVLKLTARDSVKTNLVIDTFFTSIAVVWESMAVGVVLSGTGADGTIGLKMIKEHGGITIAQDESAAYGNMPQSAVDANVVDFVLPADKIPAQLLKINHIHTIADAKAEEPLPKNDEIVFKQMLQLLQQHSGVDFTHYKQTTVRRRIGLRMAMHKRGNLADYLEFLSSDKAEQETLFQDMLISVSAFFRDPTTFETLNKKVFPAMLKNKPSDEPIRLWIAGCATGEEAYSIAICLHEFLGEKLSGRKILIFASDISEIAIKKARAGIYSITDVQPVSANWLRTYFTKTGESYQVIKKIRDLCVFANHNFLKDPPFAKMDLISCRNVLIYLEIFLQKKALTTFHYALNENGSLLLGKSETVSAASELYSTFDKQHKFFSRKTGTGQYMHVATGRREEALTSQNTKAKKVVSPTDFRSSANAILMSKSPAAVVVNDKMEIIHFHGEIAPFLKHSPGKPSLNLLKMAREGLAFELRNALHKAKNSQKSVIVQDIPAPELSKVEITESETLITIEVIPLSNSYEPHYLIIFTKIHIPKTATSLKRGSANSIKNEKAFQRNEQLEKELADAKKDMLSITEEMDSANEELQNTNEELQSINEELGITSEELQSSNEELISVNAELIEREEYLAAAREYAAAIVSTIKEPLLVLDKNLCIKTANSSFYKKFKLTENETEGREFFELQDEKWKNDELKQLLKKILPEKSRVEDFEMVIDERIILLNAREIKDVKSTEELILLTIEDVTDSKLAKKLKVSEAKLNDFFMQAPAMFAILKGPEHVFELANTAFVELIGGQNPIGKKVSEALPEVQGQGFIALLDDVFNTGETYIGNETPATFVSDEKERQVYLNFSYQANKNGESEIDGILVFAYDVTERVNARKVIEENERVIQKMAAHLKLATDSANVGTWSLDVQTQQLEWSTLHKKMWGYDEHGKDLEYKDWHKLILPEDAEKTFKKLEEARINRSIYDVDYSINRANDDAIRCIRSVGKYYYNDKGEARTLTGISIDITEQKDAEDRLKESEQLFRGLADAIPQMAWMADTEGGIYWYNERFYKYTGTTLEKMKGWGWQHLHHPDMVEITTATYKKAIASGEQWEDTFLLKGKSGEYRWFLSRAYPVKNASGTIERWIGSNTDITEQKSFSEELEKKVTERTAELTAQNTYIQTIIDSSIDLIIAFDKDLRYLSINEAANRSFVQHFPDGVIGKKMDEVVPTVHQTGVYEKALAALQGEIISQKEYFSFYEKKYYDVDYIPLRNEQEIYGLMTISRDVTENVLATLAIKKANSELEERKIFVETILETSKEYIAVYSKDFKIITINKATENLMGKKREDVIGKTLLELMPQSKGTKEESDLRIALEGKPIVNGAYLSSITGRYFENYINPLKDANGNVYAAVAIANDVTNSILRQKEIEAAKELLQIQNHTYELAEKIAQFGSYKWNTHTDALEYSDNLFLLLDCEPKEFEPSLVNFNSFIHPDDLPQVIKNRRKTIKTGVLVEAPYRIISKTGKIKYVRSNGNFVKENDQRVLIGTVQDISKDIEAAEELRNKNSELKYINAELESFNHIASHDLQEPLRKIETFISVLKSRSDSHLSDEEAEYLRKINLAANRMRNLVNDLLSFSQASKGDKIFQKSKLSKLLQNAINELQSDIEQKNASINYDVLPEANVIAFQFQQLFVNLISNSLKYSQEGEKPIITIRNEQIDKADLSKFPQYSKKQVIKISFEDNGIGFDEEYAERIFKLFQRLHNRTEYPGTGIGLAICKKILQNHKGVIYAESGFKKGAKFTFIFPKEQFDS